MNTSIDKFKRIVLTVLRRITNDFLYYKIRFLIKYRKKLNFNKPETFNEKINWLKLYDRKAIYTNLVDKYAVREYVKNKIGKEYLIELIGIFKDADEINFDLLPDKFVLKATHGSGWVLVCNDKSSLNIKLTKKRMKHWLNNNFYSLWGEWPYKNVPPAIICEKNISKENKALLDYKFYCFNGNPKFIHVDFDRFENHTRNFYDLNWNRLPYQHCYPNNDQDALKPVKINEMISIASKLSTNFKFVRVDLYEVDEKIYFGELTFYPDNGFGQFSHYKHDLEIGNLLEL
ncbi:ATP-grasp fold amidoligase family protein [Maribellus sediminis]|uniref:ATP-grasp fold amidoligase family protein n=1 Tax=Maribellus sediminis TaxID=2696285 RepID=UPI00142F9A1F|nr:ATP-grasp fold amidoligase family protein [Maribellus sediminis]